MTAKILRIAQMGHPVLRELSQPVENISDPEVQRLIDDMLATVQYLNCTGLAAPQVFRPLRIVVFRILKTTDTRLWPFFLREISLIFNWLFADKRIKSSLLFLFAQPELI